MTKLLLIFAAAIPLFGQQGPCTYTPNPGSPQNPILVGGDGAGVRITVTTQAGCAFVMATDATWIHLVPPANGRYFLGPSQVSFTVDANPGTLLRASQIQIHPGTEIDPTILPIPIPVTQIAQTCNYAIAPASASVPVTGGLGTIFVTTGCTWGASATTFVALAFPNGTVGTGPLNYQVAPNTCVAQRSGQINVVQGSNNSTIVFPIAQDGSPANLTIPATSQTVGPGALSNQQFIVTTGSVCRWAAYTDSNWVHTIGTSGSGTGVGTYVYSLDANPGGQRTGHVYFQSGLDASGLPITAATLTITQQAIPVVGPSLSAILNDASYAIGSVSPGPVSPGEIVALFGTNMGPTPGVTNTQTFGTTLGGVQVMFGSTAAPLIYASAQQINAVVPYSAGGASNVAVTVQYGGQTSPPLTVPVQATTPGIFSIDHMGSGPGAILNQDYSLNSSAIPAAAGSVVAIYCTGAGATVPASQDGALTTLTPPFPTLAAQPVTVTIGGISAQVVYAGPAPGAIAGLTQIDAVVPGGITPSSSVPVVVSIGGVQSQGNLLMAVK